jgi:hypothetical protein
VKWRDEDGKREREREGGRQAHPRAERERVDEKAIVEGFSPTPNPPLS